MKLSSLLISYQSNSAPTKKPLVKSGFFVLSKFAIDYNKTETLDWKNNYLITKKIKYKV